MSDNRRILQTKSKKVGKLKKRDIPTNNDNVFLVVKVNDETRNDCENSPVRNPKYENNSNFECDNDFNEVDDLIAEELVETDFGTETETEPKNSDHNDGNIINNEDFLHFYENEEYLDGSLEESESSPPINNSNSSYHIETGIRPKVSYSWDDTATRLFLSIYKVKRELVTSKQLRTYKVMWDLISDEMIQAGYNVSPLQVENKFKTMQRAYNNMLGNNRRNGKRKISCNYEEELHELFSENRTKKSKVDDTKNKVDETKNKEDETNNKVDETQNKVNETQNKVNETQNKVNETQNKVYVTNNILNNAPYFVTTVPYVNAIINIPTTSTIATNTSILPEKETNSTKTKSTQTKPQTECTNKALLQIKKCIEDYTIVLREQEKYQEERHENIMKAFHAYHSTTCKQREEQNRLLGEMIQLLKGNRDS